MSDERDAAVPEMEPTLAPMTVARTRELLGPEVADKTDAEIEQMIFAHTRLADVLFDAFVQKVRHDAAAAPRPPVDAEPWL